MIYTQTHVKSRVVKTVGKKTVKSMMSFLQRNGANLWGLNKNQDFLKKTLILTLFKDIEGIGINKLLAGVKHWYPVSDKSLNHNIKEIRRVLANWGTHQIFLGYADDWNDARDNSWYPDSMKRTNLWVDSSDFGLTGKRKISRKSDEWSYKLNGPGRRFMMFMDGSMVVRALFGPYSPKIHDSCWLEANQDWIRENLWGGAVVGDCHFSWGRKRFDHTKFYVPYSKTCRNYREMIPFNKEARKVRSSVESVFGQLDTMFKSLSEPFASGDEQLGYLVKIAVGIHNFKKTNGLML